MPYDDPRMQPFIEQLEPVNASAEQHPGFVWRLESDQVHDPELAAFEASGWLVNMSVWQSIEALKGFICSPGHLAVMRRRGEWFTPWPEATMVLWWVLPGHKPDFAEALEKLERLRSDGPSAEAFSFSDAFDPPVELAGAA